MPDMTASNFPVVDYERVPDVDIQDDEIVIYNDRSVLAEHGVIEPHDDREDCTVAIPIRTVHTPWAGLSIEIGPYSLDSSEIVRLHNYLVEHINSTNGAYFKRT